MKILMKAFVFMIVLVSIRDAKIGPNAPSSNNALVHANTAAEVPLDAPVCTIYPFPLQPKYVTTEGKPFVIAISADCPPNSPTDPTFEFLQPAPRFVNFSDVYRGPRSALTLLLISPQPGDAGTYGIIFNVKACSGGTGCGFTGFTLKVKPA